MRVSAPDLFDPLTIDDPDPEAIDQLFGRVKEAFGGNL